MSTRRNVKPEPNIMVRGAYRDGVVVNCSGERE